MRRPELVVGRVKRLVRRLKKDMATIHFLERVPLGLMGAPPGFLRGSGCAARLPEWRALWFLFLGLCGIVTDVRVSGPRILCSPVAQVTPSGVAIRPLTL